MFENTIYYATGNAGKMGEVTRYSKLYAPHVIMDQFAYDLPELQSLDITEVAAYKAEAAWTILQKPVLVDDSGVFIDRYKGFPGTMTKCVTQTLGLAGFMRLIDAPEPMRLVVALAYAYGPGKIKIFKEECKGHCIKIDTITGADSLPYRQCFVPEGQTQPQSYFQGTDIEDSFNPRVKALEKFFSWHIAQNKDIQNV